MKQQFKHLMLNNEEESFICGSLSGLCNFYGWDTTIARLLVIILAIATPIGGLLIFIYFVAYFIFPLYQPRYDNENEIKWINVEKELPPTSCYIWTKDINGIETKIKLTKKLLHRFKKSKITLKDIQNLNITHWAKN